MKNFTIEELIANPAEKTPNEKTPNNYDYREEASRLYEEESELANFIGDFGA